MKQSTIKIILGVLVLLGLLSSMTSCSKSGKVTPTVIRTGKDIYSGIKKPLYVARDLNVYAVGDTVWVLDNKITANTWNKDIPTNMFKLFVIVK